MSNVLKNIVLIAFFLVSGLGFGMKSEQKGPHKAAGLEKTKKDKLEYTINLMWINKKLNAYQKYIYPAINEKDLMDKFLTHIFNWAKKTSQNAIVNVWYDSELTPKIAITNTQEQIGKFMEKNPNVAPIELRDIRKLQYVKDFPDVFSEKVPVYFRVDLARVIASVYEVSTGATPYFIYADIDMKPLSQNELFDNETIENLKKFGIVLARGEGLGFNVGFENGFFILGYNKNLFEALDWAIIKSNISRCNYFLKERKFPMNFAQYVYMSYGNMLRYFYFLEGYGDLRTDERGQDETYNKKVHSLTPFGTDINQASLKFISNNKQITDDGFRITAPVKQVDLPPAGLQY